ncbi:MAG: hypothetical protein KGL39_10515 [Patescibacteria group bacterium]|nr:hypothetical protein [Patescibacteria group bacterium]
MSEKKGETLYVAVDVEKKGAKFEHPIIQIGVAYGTSLQNVKTRSFCFDYANVPFEQRCYDEFWSKFLDTYKRIQAEAKEPKGQWKAFADFLQELEDQYPSIEIWSDNPAYDVEAIDFHLNDELKRAGIRYSSKMQYRYVTDYPQVLIGLPKHLRDAIKQKAMKLAAHTHWAEDDAKNIFVRSMLIKNVVAIMRRAEDEIAATLA